MTMKRDTLCWKCNLTGGNCEWSKEFKPVPGWKAKACKIEGEDSYLVTKCPKFQPLQMKRKSFQRSTNIISKNTYSVEETWLFK